MPAHASRTLAPAPSAPPSRAERRLLAPVRPRHRPASAATPAELSASPAARPVKLRSVDSGLEERFDLGLQIPEEIDSLSATLLRMRNALEHIDERAMGEAKDGTADSAMSIFLQPHFVDQGVLIYAGGGMSFTKGVPVALGHCREVIMSVIDLRARG